MILLKTMVQRLELEIIEQQTLDTDLHKLVFAMPAGQKLEFEAGQFMSVAVDGFIRRSYSLSNPPSESDKLETYADVSPHGPAFKLFSQSKVGDKVNVLAPLGHFTYKPDTKPVYFFAAGTGIVPFLSMIKHELAVVKSGREVNLLLGVRNEKRLVWDQELKQIADSHPNFHYVPFVSRAEGEWEGRSGRITSAISEMTDKNVDAYICGGKVVIDDVEQLLLAQGVAAESIFYERYY